MQIKEGFVLRKVADHYVVIATGEASRNFHGMIKLNETGADIWQGLIEGYEVKEIVIRLMEKYGIDEEKAATDVGKLLRQIGDAGFLEE